MSLITIDRSIVCEEQEQEKTQLPVEEAQNTTETGSKSSHSEDFFLCKSSAVTLNVKSQRKTSIVRNHDNLHEHLKRILHTLRFTDYVKLVCNHFPNAIFLPKIVKLENANPRPIWFRYLAIIATLGSQGSEEAVVMGVDVYQSSISIGFMLPILQDMVVSLDGDGGFKLANKDSVRLFKPVSVQALWAAHQAIMSGCRVAQQKGFHSRGTSHSWIAHYQEIPISEAMMMFEWNKMEDIEEMGRATPPTTAFTKDAITETEQKSRDFKNTIRLHLLRIMASVDLEDINLVQLREMLEEQMGVSLKLQRHFIADQVLAIYGQMDAPSQIFDHLYLGSTFNASNGDELRRNNVTHIVNVTREVDNFFPADQFVYKNIRVFDDEKAQLLPFWDETFRFINEARANGTRCLVHCKMGISRSGSTVVAYVMKENGWKLEQALDFVKSKRTCVNPNANFLRQLETYQGILEASSHRHSAIFQNKVSSCAARPLFDPLSHHSNSCGRFCPIGCEDGGSGGILEEEAVEQAIEDDVDMLTTAMPEDYNTIINDSATSAEPAQAIDLDVELFVFKTFPQSMQAGEEFEENALLERNYSPTPDDPPTVGLKRTVLATTSQRIRHWHPDVYEDGGGGSGVVQVCRSKSSPSPLRKLDTTTTNNSIRQLPPPPSNSNKSPSLPIALSLVSPAQLSLSTAVLTRRRSITSSCGSGLGFELEFSQSEPIKLPPQQAYSDGGASSISHHNIEINSSLNLRQSVCSPPKVPSVAFSLGSPQLAAVTPNPAPPGIQFDTPNPSPDPAAAPSQVTIRKSRASSDCQHRHTEPTADRLGLSFLDMVPDDDQLQRPVRALSLRLRPDDSWIIKRDEEGVEPDGVEDRSAKQPRSFSDTAPMSRTPGEDVGEEDEEALNGTMVRRESYSHPQMFHQTPLSIGALDC